ncbi:histidinol phosphate phosphatase [Methylobacterium sp. Leaf456]|uniref:inositol monophosphatase family protein n=1 Tax=Methylobacterium sp. Leaf456 TaxID=1736382 RepID=UPI0006FDB748|nr:inositol monophosphatase family protein [Methylobacterium sp. Leaf456]KQT58036.1 histidinol phosphate phosphatase [Methylobacterium sp. Leaf456]
MHPELVTFALHLADLVRPLARAHFRTPLTVEAKADASPVTEADRGIEALLRAEIRRTYPSHGILGEEEGGDLRAARTWVIDPIDGTKSFVTGLPLFGTLIALAEAGRPVLGVIDMPILGELWHGTSGRAWFGEIPAKASRRRLSDARIFIASPDRFAGEDAAAVARLSERAALRRYGGDCYAYGLLASGHCDLVVEAGLAIYDVFALVPVVEGAGGVITDWQGRPLGPDFDGRVLAAANPALHLDALDRLVG